MALELIKENIEYEQLFGISSADNVMKPEYVIPDTHPDVLKILMIDARPVIYTKEIVQDRIRLEGQVIYDIIYLTRQEDKGGVHNVTYSERFSNNIEVSGAASVMKCEAECLVEHMDCIIINERKIGIRGILKSRVELYKGYDFEIVKEVRGSDDIQILKNPSSVDKIVTSVNTDLIAKTTLRMPGDEGAIDSIIKSNVSVHKRDVKIYDGKMQIEAYVKVEVLYRRSDGGELDYICDDVFVRKEAEINVSEEPVDSYTDFRVESVESNISEDELGEKRQINIEALIKADTKVMRKEEIDIIEDAYSPSIKMEMNKKNFELNVIHDISNTETIVKENLEIDDGKLKPSQVLIATGKATIIDKKLLENKVVIDGVLKVEIMYKTSDEKEFVSTKSEEIPFTTAVEIPGCKIDMQCFCKAFIESIEASIEADTLAIKAIIKEYIKVSYLTHKEFLVNITAVEGEALQKKASITIYVIQPGDTLWKIAKKYFTTIDTILKINFLESQDLIGPGQKLIIPGRAILE